ncbi:2-succinyl-5-enolpyruvyl-6-hydroxy-3-cyclohexene-1-carboxylic-acid synthase [Mobilicoccus pelagius]|uniref:2-succinyl-5-enolpyruvyl-6-hydroxy-3-cyclohexene-1-carboxylate synthase n=1 Tax=Mobilicoccus pelagius NBRC 104925 TaxID=1089455 RepID=H5UQD8_9MICO|nr:2-succinyl-5-enolpyruvyl-6-hydroxy-3-cyclohexene-1-carboxylic-acid synthase [Mobilicoccus pelagius]GAB47946.1 2-succinyl-5-enolpyruvyl-6-hydroxy-3-cyclohexene-1-carboxylate synthase [Mobilicoccus pelagius NBRC 104925]
MNPQQALAGVVVDELVRLGVREIVLAPGSRSAPFAYALHEAAVAGRLRVHVRVDERSAAFLALGLAKATGLPAPVVTTSGTAVANLTPALLEAHEAGVPMLLLTADRPPELRGTRANQTTDQVGFFRPFTRWSHDLGVPESRPGAPAAWRTAIDRAVAAATGTAGGDPGPVHVNAPLRDPLVPDAPTGAPAFAGTGTPAAADDPLAGRPDGGPWTQVPARRTTWGSPALSEVARTLVVLGDAPRAVLEAAVAWATRRCHPVIGEPFGPALNEGGVGRLPHGVRLAARVADEEALRPERIVVVGRLTLSRSLARLLRLDGVHVELVTGDTRWADPGHVVHAVHDPACLLPPATGDPRPDGGAVIAGGDLEVGAAADDGAGAAIGPAGVPADGSPTPPARPVGAVTEEAQEFRAAWTAASATERALLAEALDDARHSHEAQDPEDSQDAERGPSSTAEDLAWPAGPVLADTLLTALPPSSRLFLGSSNGVRHVDLVRGLRGPDEAEVVASRGLAGIDGCVSTATGLALADDRPTYALLGDLTFLHDANGLLIGPGEPVPDLTLIVANDDGGAIFGDLEYGDAARREAHPGVFERMFRTPTGTDLAALCAAHGVRHVRAETPAPLAAEVARIPDGLTVVEVPLASAPAAAPTE